MELMKYCVKFHQAKHDLRFPLTTIKWFYRGHESHEAKSSQFQPLSWLSCQWFLEVSIMYSYDLLFNDFHKASAQLWLEFSKLLIVRKLCDGHHKLSDVMSVQMLRIFWWPNTTSESFMYWRTDIFFPLVSVKVEEIIHQPPFGHPNTWNGQKVLVIW